MRTSVLLLAALLRAATGWSDTEDWSYEEWSDGWQHNAGSAQDVFYAEGPGDTDALPQVPGRLKITGGYSVSAGGSFTGEDGITRREGFTGKGGQVTSEIPLPLEGPFFAKQPTQIVSAVGHNVTFQCRVQNIEEKEVIWMRSRDLQILSVGPAVYSSDPRVSAAQLDATRPDTTRRDVTRRDRTHNLTIALLRPSDAGKYECQLNTDPKRSLYFNLTVLPVMPQIEIWVTGGGAVREGSVAVLRCAARLRVVEPSRGDSLTHAVKLALRWYKDGEPVELQSEGGVSVTAYGGGAWRRSVLRVRRVTGRRAGRYECRAAPHAAAHAHLTVLAGWATESWADGMQRDQAVVSASSRRSAPGAPLPRAAAVLALGALLAALATRVLLDCTGGLAHLHY